MNGTFICPKTINIRKKELNKYKYKNLIDWLKNSNHLYIGRVNIYVEGAIKSKWANPFPINDNRKGCLEQYEKYIRESNLINDLHELNGKILGCWCHPLECHGHILQKLFTEKFIK